MLSKTGQGHHGYKYTLKERDTQLGGGAENIMLFMHRYIVGRAVHINSPMLVNQGSTSHGT